MRFPFVGGVLDGKTLDIEHNTEVGQKYVAMKGSATGPSFTQDTYVNRGDHFELEESVQWPANVVISE